MSSTAENIEGMSVNELSVVLEVVTGPDGDLITLVRDLRDELRYADFDADLVENEVSPVEAKSGGGLARYLELHGLTLNGLRAVMVTALAWVTRTRRRVEIKIGKDVLVLDWATAEQQDRLIDAFVSRHASGK